MQPIGILVKGRSSELGILEIESYLLHSLVFTLVA